VDDRLVVTTLTTLLAYGSYLLAERLHVSGVLAVVLAGIISGNVGMAGASPSTKIMLYNLWDFLAFLSNSLVFLLIGLEVDLPEVWNNLGPIAVAVGAVLVSRAMAIYGLPLIVHLFVRDHQGQLPLKWRHVLFWGGLRGAISLALALSVPIALAERQMLLSMAFGVLLFTLLAQGTTLQFLLKGLGLIERPDYLITREHRLGRLFATKAGLQRLRELNREGVLPEMIWDGLHKDYVQDQSELEEQMRTLFHQHAELEREMLIQARREALQTERIALGEAVRRGLLGEDVYEPLRDDVDRRLEALDLIEASIREGQRQKED
jgi:CPA1 family monovalent cation:H+ antiporter